MDAFSTALRTALTTHGVTQRTLSERMNLSAAEVNRVLKGLKLPGLTFLQSVCANATWNDTTTGLQLLRAWLEDEIVRAGRSPQEILPVVAGDSPQAHAIEDDLRVLRQWLPGEVDILPVIRQIADCARRELAQREQDDLDHLPRKRVGTSSDQVTMPVVEMRDEDAARKREAKATKQAG